MPKISPIQSSFAAGEVSSKVYGRIDSAGYKQGVKELTNFIPDTRGSVSNRGGFKWKYAINPSRIGDEGNVNIFHFPVGIARQDNYICVFSHLSLQIKKSLDVDLANQLVNSDFTGDNSAWEIEKDAGTTVEFSDNRCRLTAEDGKTCSISQGFYQPSSTVGMYVYGLLGRHTGEELTLTISSAPFGAGTVYHTADMKDMLPVYHLLSKVINPATNPIFLTLTQKSIAGNKVTSTVDKVYFGGYSSPLMSFTSGSLIEDKMIPSIQFQMNPEGTEAYITSESSAPYKITYDRASEVFGYVPIPLTHPGAHPEGTVELPPEWTGDNYPTTMDFFGGRSWWGGCKNNPDQIWGSASGAYHMLGDGTGTEATDPMKFTTTKYGRIEWIRATNHLLIGTDTHEFKLWSGDNSDSLIHPPNHYLVEQETSYGSVGFKPIEIGRESVFITPDRETLRTLEYNEWQAGGYVSQDLSYVSDEITKGKIKDLAMMNHPQRIILAVLKDGTLIMCNYHREGSENSPLMGWSKHRIHEGVIQTVCAVETQDFTEIFIGVRRIVEGKFVVTVESLAMASAAHDIEVHPRSFAFLDTYSVRTGEAFVDFVSNLGHLEGKWVTPVVDYAVQKPVQVISGSITLEYPGRFIIVGVPYESTLETLPFVEEKEGASSLGYMKRWVKSYLYLKSSIKPLINGQRPPERHASSPMNMREPGRTEIVEVINLGRERLQTIKIVNDKPLPVTVLGVFGEMSQDSL